jgi:hypothetical protein
MSVQTPDNDGNSASRPVQTAMGDALKQAGVGQDSNQQGRASDQRASQQSNNRNSRAGLRSVVNINSRMSRPVSRNSTGEVLQAYLKAFNAQHEAIADDATRQAYRIIPLDNNSVQIALSAIMICFQRMIDNKSHVAVFTLLVEQSNTRLNNRYESILGQNVEIEVVPGDVYDQVMWNQELRALTAYYGADIVAHSAGAMPLPAELSVEDKHHIHQTFYVATQACYTILDSEVSGRESAFNIATDVEPTDVLTASLDYNPLPETTPTGLPIRTDISVSLRATANGGNASANLDLHSRGIELVRVDGYVDLVFREPLKQIQNYNQPPQTQHYFPRFVMTRVDSEFDALTPEIHLFGIAQSTILSMNMGWSGVYLPRSTNRSGDDLRDIGAVGYEVNLTGNPDARPERVDTKSDTFTRQNLFKLISTLIEPSLVYSLDVEETGAETFLTQTYMEAADGNMQAYERIITAANNLTNNHFNDCFDRGMIARNDMNRVMLGYYFGEDGLKHDLREIDYLAMLNLRGGVDMQNVIDFAATYDNVEIPLAMRLEKRSKLIRSMILGGVHVKGMARRITFAPNFMAALNTACHRAGLVVRPQNIIADFNGAAGRAQYDAASMAINPQMAGATSAFQYTQANYGQNGRNIGGMAGFGRYMG